MSWVPNLTLWRIRSFLGSKEVSNMDWIVVYDPRFTVDKNFHLIQHVSANAEYEMHRILLHSMKSIE
jgi:hypothetical protein